MLPFLAVTLRQEMWATVRVVTGAARNAIYFRHRRRRALRRSEPGAGRDYQPADGDPFPARVIARRPDASPTSATRGSGRRRQRFDLRVAEVPNPSPGDRLILDGETFVIQGEPVRDSERLIWTLDMRPA